MLNPMNIYTPIRAEKLTLDVVLCHLFKYNLILQILDNHLLGCVPMANQTKQTKHLTDIIYLSIKLWTVKSKSLSFGVLCSWNRCYISIQTFTQCAAHFYCLHKPWYSESTISFNKIKIQLCGLSLNLPTQSFWYVH